MLKDWINTYQCRTPDDVRHANREIVQHITIAGLARSDFFEKASFYGGTALRIIYGMQRFSEDIDFSLNEKNMSFRLEKYFSYIEEECKLLNMDVALAVKDKVNLNAVDSTFLKDNTEWNIVSFYDKRGVEPELKIKIEIDRNPPLNFETEQKLIIKPYSFYLTAFKEEYLFAGKMHALLFREWKTRIKGRDWYDMEWYIKRGTKLNLSHLETRAQESNHWPEGKVLSKKDLLVLLEKRIIGLDVESARLDIQRFVINQDELKIWSKQYFHDLVSKIIIAD